MTASTSVLISQSIPVLAAVSSDSPVNQLAPIMAPSLDSLINLLVPIKITEANSSSGAKLGGAIIEAVVLSSKPLLPSSNDGGQYKLVLSDGKQQLEIISKVLIQAGSQLQIKISENNQSAVLLKVLDSNPAHTTASTKPDNHQNTTLKTTTPVLNRNTIAPPPTITDTLITNNTLLKPTDKDTALSPRRVIEQGARQSLPRQQPIQQLVQLLHQILEQKPPHWPKELSLSVRHLLQQFPTAEQMQHAKPVKLAIENSGIFLESKLARLAMTDSPALTNPAKSALHSELQSDIKAIFQHLSQLIEKSSGVKSAPSCISPTVTQSEHDLELNFPIYSSKASLMPKTQTNKTTNTEQNLDIILRQLGRQLLASIARTQLNQLESLASRQKNSIDNQGPSNSWVTEIPIVHGKHVDNLTVRIDQETPEQSEKVAKKTQKLWTVMLAFDLHTLGKMNVQLKILNNSVSAIVWSSQEKTHLHVKQHIKELTQNLQKVGVSVTQVDCQLGLPPSKQSTLLQQLVDVRT